MSGRWHAALPAFENASQLHAAPSWERYLTAVYGMPLVYPVRLRTFSFFHLPLLPSALRPHSSPMLGYRKSVDAPPWDGATLKVDDARRHPLLRGRRRGEHYRRDGSAPGHAAGGLWIYAWPEGRDQASSEPLYPSAAGYPSGAKVEVMHCQENTTLYRRIGEFWMYQATGSGIFFDLGRTIAFPNGAYLARWTGLPPMLHRRRTRDSYTYALVDGCEFNRSSATFACETSRSAMHQGALQFAANVRLLRNRYHYDSLQLTRTEEHGMCHYEILDLRQHRWPASAPTACGAAHPVAKDFYSGWRGVRRCACEEEGRQCLNCEHGREENKAVVCSGGH